MSKNFYNLLREKNKLEKERDKALSKLLYSIANWEFLSGEGKFARRIQKDYGRH